MDIRGIAKQAKVSTATVSRTLNLVPSVKPALAKRVWRVVNDLGFCPNTQARSLVTGESRIFGVITPGICHPFYGSIVEDFQLLAEKRNYEVILSTTGHDLERLRLSTKRMIGRRVDGIAILGIDVPKEIIAEIAHAHVPIVVADLAKEYPPARNIRIDYLHGIRQAVQHLAALRHNRIAFVTGPPHLSAAASRRHAFEKSMEEISLCVAPQFIFPGDHSIECGKYSMAQLARLPYPPSAVICASDLTAVGLLQEASKRGIRIPRDLSVVGIEDIWLSQFSVPALTTVQLSHAKLAECAFTALLKSSENHSFLSDAGGCDLITELVLRSSTSISRTGGHRTRPPLKSSRRPIDSGWVRNTPMNPDLPSLEPIPNEILQSRRGKVDAT